MFNVSWRKQNLPVKLTRDTNGNHVQEVGGKKIIGTGGDLLFCQIWGKKELVSVFIYAVSASAFKQNLPWVLNSYNWREKEEEESCN